MEIEVQQPSGIYLKASVKAITPEDLEVLYKNDVKPGETVPYERCRVARKNHTVQPSFKAGDTIEAFLKDSQGWHVMKIRETKVGLFI